MPPLLLGVINKTKAWFAGRRGPPLLQAYYDLARLFRKEMVFSETTTWVFRAGPIVTASAVLLAGMLTPFGAFDAPVHFTGDLVLFAYLFALARFFTTAAALDTGSAFEGMGAAREVSFACLAEVALFTAFVVLVRFSGALSLTPMLHAPALSDLHGLPAAALFLVGVALFVVLLAESARVPVDDPNTHLELTMIHEVMVPDHSGLRTRALSSAVKMFLLERAAASGDSSRSASRSSRACSWREPSRSRWRSASWNPSWQAVAAPRTAVDRPACCAPSASCSPWPERRSECRDSRW
jgi:formate hydrogenlyase subunit 4